MHSARQAPKPLSLRACAGSHEVRVGLRRARCRKTVAPCFPSLEPLLPRRFRRIGINATAVSRLPRSRNSALRVATDPPCVDGALYVLFALRLVPLEKFLKQLLLLILGAGR